MSDAEELPEAVRIAWLAVLEAAGDVSRAEAALARAELALEQARAAEGAKTAEEGKP